MREFFTTENTESTEKALVKLSSSCCEHSRSGSAFPYFRQRPLTTENTEGTEKKPEEKKPERLSSVPSVFSVVNDLPGTANGRLTRRREGQPCS
jgi:hypothetical protein